LALGHRIELDKLWGVQISIISILKKKILISKKYLFTRIQKNYFFGSMKISLTIQYLIFLKVQYLIFKEIFIDLKNFFKYEQRDISLKLRFFF